MTLLNFSVEEICPECEQASEFAVSAERNELSEYQVKCPVCDTEFKLYVNLEIDSWAAL